MRLDLPSLSVLSPLALAALVSRWGALRAKFTAAPPPAQAANPVPPSRVDIALRAAARARL